MAEENGKPSSPLIKILMLFGVLVLLAGVAFAVISMMNKNKSEKQLQDQRKLIKVNWQDGGN